MKLKITAAALLLISSFSMHASTIDYSINVTDSNKDTFVGIADYDINLDVFTSVSGTLTFADGSSTSSLLALDQVGYFPYSSGSGVGPAIYGVAWADVIYDRNYAGGLYILLDSSPSVPTPKLDPTAFISSNDGVQYQITSGGITLPEPSSVALLAAGILSLGLSRRKFMQ